MMKLWILQLVLHIWNGGNVKNVPFSRLFISKVANKFVGFSMPQNLSTVTSVLRAYRREVVESMELESNDTNINLEILSKAIATRYKIKEVPAVLEGRELGKSKLKFRSKTISHVIFSLYEKPMILFGVIGLVLCLIGINRWNLSILSIFNRYTQSNKAIGNIYCFDDNIWNTNTNFWIRSNSNKPS